MSRRTAESNKAILAAWNKERELVQDGKGTREWTLQQQQDILDKGKAYDEDGVAFQGQHMKSAEMYPEYQGDPGNIQFLTRVEHLEAHDGNWKNPTNWSFNPVTKEKTDFGDGSFIPCDIIQLAEPLIKPHIEHVESRTVAQKTVNDTKLKVQQGAESKVIQKSIPNKQANVVNQSTLGFGQKFKHIKHIKKMIGNTIVEFPEKHPTAVKVIKGVGIAVPTIATVVAELSKSGASIPRDRQSDESVNYGGFNNDESEGSFNDCSGDKSGSENSNSQYTPNDVPAGKQRYHYKDGGVKWKDKSPYHRGGNKDE